MKKRRIKTSNWIYGLIISLLGFSQGCSLSGRPPKMYGPPMPEYGTPNAEFKISGRVTDMNDKAINNIEVTVKEVYEGNTKTNSQGSYSLEYSNFPNRKLEITYKDIDGEENGGEFETHAETVILTDKDFVGGSGNWNKGSVSKEVNAKLRLKDTQDQ